MATTSPKFSLQALDFLKSLAVAALSQPILVILTSLAAGTFTINWTEQWHLAVSAGAAYLIKNFFSGVTPPTSGSSSVSKTIIIFLLCSSLIGSLSAQSIFKPIPKPSTKLMIDSYAKTLTATSGGDSSLTAIRPVAIAAAYGYESGGVSTLMAGTGMGVKHLVYDPTAQKWNSQYSFNLIAWAQGQVAPSGNINPFAFSFGPTIGFLNDNIMVGGAWDFTHGKPMMIISFSIPTNN